MTICHTLRTRAHLYNKLDLFSLQNSPRRCTIWDRGSSKLLVRGDNAGIWGYTYSANVTFKSPHKSLLTSCTLRNALYVRHMITRVIKRSIGEITFKKCKTHVSQRVGHESVHLVVQIINYPEAVVEGVKVMRHPEEVIMLNRNRLFWYLDLFEILLALTLCACSWTHCLYYYFVQSSEITEKCGL